MKNIENNPFNPENFQLYLKDEDGRLKTIEGLKSISFQTEDPEHKEERKPFSLQLTGRIERCCQNCKHCMLVIQDEEDTFFCTATSHKHSIQVQAHFRCSNGRFECKDLEENF